MSQGTADNDILITLEKETECNVVRHEDKRMNDMILNYCETKNVSYGFVCTIAEMLIVLRVQWVQDGHYLSMDGALCLDQQTDRIKPLSTREIRYEAANLDNLEGW